jgi:hypothetical protein
LLEIRKLGDKEEPQNRYDPQYNPVKPFNPNLDPATVRFSRSTQTEKIEYTSTVKYGVHEFFYIYFIVLLDWHEIL